MSGQRDKITKRDKDKKTKRQKDKNTKRQKDKKTKRQKDKREWYMDNFAFLPFSSLRFKVYSNRMQTLMIYACYTICDEISPNFPPHYS